MSALPKVIEHDAGPGQAIVVQAQTPMAMLSGALERGMDVSVIKDLMDLQQRWEKSEAEKAYNVAFAAFKASAVSVIRNKVVTDGPLKGKSYAELHAVVDAVTPELSAHGLSASWKVTKDEKDWLEVTCTLKHIKGHAEFVSFGGPPDAGGAKNAIQARASTKTYLERYTLLAVTGLAAKDADNDGGAGATVMAQEDLAGWVKKIQATTTEKGAKDMCAEAIKAADSFNDLTAYRTFKEALKDHLAFIAKAGK